MDGGTPSLLLNPDFWVNRILSSAQKKSVSDDEKIAAKLFKDNIKFSTFAAFTDMKYFHVQRQVALDVIERISSFLTDEKARNKFRKEIEPFFNEIYSE